MAVTASDLGSAAARHLRCAIQLAKQREQAEACYLIGLAAECAVKKHLTDTGFPLVRHKRKIKDKPKALRGDPLYLHFPALATELLVQGQGIIASRILSRVGNPAFMKGWDVRMRYKNQQSTPAVAQKFLVWRQQVDDLFTEVGL